MLLRRGPALGLGWRTPNDGEFATQETRPRMIELYHCVSARSFRPLWALEELGAPYQLRMLPFPPRALQRSYLALNPLGTVPLLLDGDTRMTESSAMC